MLYVLDFPSATTHGPPAQNCLQWEAGPIRTLSIHFIRCCRWAAQARIENAFPWTAKRVLSMSLMLVTGGAWALYLAKLVLLCPLTGRSIHRPSTDKEGTTPLKSTGAQHNLLTAQRDAQEREREHEGRISCGLLQKFSHRRLLHLGSSSPQRAPRALAPLVLLPPLPTVASFFFSRTNSVFILCF